MRDFYISRGWKFRRDGHVDEPVAPPDVEQLIARLNLTSEERAEIQAGKVPPAVLERIKEVGREADGIAEE